MSNWLDGPIFNILEKSLDASSLRQKVLANNVANVDTPGFKRSDVDFQEVLGQALGEGNNSGGLALKRTSPQHLPGSNEGAATGVVTDENTSFRNDGNNVDVDREMANVAENGIYYNSVTRAISAELGLMRMVIQGKP
ncbi:MAG: flagellar basal body rod protein FlgB [Desulfitobacteriaceae bacterium]